MSRLAMKDFTFSDGTFIPQGTFVSAIAMPMHRDDEFYPDGEMFNPWRFSEMRDEDGEGLRHQMVSTGSDYIAFGHGKHAWYVFLCFPPLEPHVDVDIALVASLLPTRSSSYWLAC